MLLAPHALDCAGARPLRWKTMLHVHTRAQARSIRHQEPVGERAPPILQGNGGRRDSTGECAARELGGKWRRLGPRREGRRGLALPVGERGEECRRKQRRKRRELIFDFRDERSLQPRAKSVAIGRAQLTHPLIALAEQIGNERDRAGRVVVDMREQPSPWPVIGEDGAERRPGRRQITRRPRAPRSAVLHPFRSRAEPAERVRPRRRRA